MPASFLEQRWTPDLGKNVFLRPNTSDDQTWSDTFIHMYHVPPEKITPRTILDLGANIGLTAAHYRAMWPDARIRAYEMDVDNAAVCAQNFDGELAVAAIGGETRLGSYTQAGGRDSYTITAPGEIRTNIIALADVLDDFGDVDFCKMDIEGAEWEVITSANWADRVGHLLVELHSPSDWEWQILKGRTMLEDRGFKVKRHTIHHAALWATH
jgi:FkbM family methyltransferase